MIANHSDNAVLAKARAMYGKRLTTNDYNSLLECNNVSDIASYLKQIPRYEDELSVMTEAEVHRGRLEENLKVAFYNECATLCRYEITTLSSYFYKYIIGKSEIECIMQFLAMLSAGRTDEFIYTIPLYLDKHSETDIHALAGVRSYDDLLKVMEKTDYYSIFKNNMPVNNEINLTEIENELYNSLYGNVFFIIDKYTNGNEKKELEDIFNSHINIVNFDRILRLKKYYHLSGEQITNKLYPFGTLTKKQIDAMCNAETSNDVYSIMKRTRAGRSFMRIEYAYSGEIAARLNIKKSKHNIRFSVYPSIVMLSYLFIAEREMKNLMSIIEGVRYQIDPDIIRNILIF